MTKLLSRAAARARAEELGMVMATPESVQRRLQHIASGLARASAGARYNSLAMKWALSEGLELFAVPPEAVRRRLLNIVFDEPLATSTGPKREQLEALRDEAMAPGSTWPQSGPDGSMWVSDFNKALRLGFKPWSRSR